MKSVQTGILFFLLTAISCSYGIKNAQVTTYDFDKASMEADKSIEEYVAPFKGELDQKMSEVIGSNEYEMKKTKPESTLGNFMSDACMVTATKYTQQNIDFCLMNYGGIRIPSIAPGDIRIGKIFELMPFENYLVVLDMKGSKVNQLFDQINRSRGWPASKEVSMAMDTSQRTYDLHISGKPVKKDKMYNVLLPDYIANGGDDCSFLKECKRENLGVLVRDAIIEYVRDEGALGNAVSFKKEGRMRYE